MPTFEELLKLADEEVTAIQGESLPIEFVPVQGGPGREERREARLKRERDTAVSEWAMNTMGMPGLSPMLSPMKVQPPPEQRVAAGRGALAGAEMGHERLGAGTGAVIERTLRGGMRTMGRGIRLAHFWRTAEEEESYTRTIEELGEPWWHQRKVAELDQKLDEVFDQADMNREGFAAQTAYKVYDFLVSLGVMKAIIGLGAFPGAAAAGKVGVGAKILAITKYATTRAAYTYFTQGGGEDALAAAGVTFLYMMTPAASGFVGSKLGAVTTDIAANAAITTAREVIQTRGYNMTPDLLAGYISDFIAALGTQPHKTGVPKVVAERIVQQAARANEVTVEEFRAELEKQFAEAQKAAPEPEGEKAPEEAPPPAAKPIEEAPTEAKAEPPPAAERPADEEAPPTPTERAEAQASGDEAYGFIKDALVDAGRERIGLPPAIHGASRTQQEILDTAAARFEEDRFIGQRTLDSLERQSRPHTTEEGGILVYEMARLRVEREHAEAALDDARASGDEADIREATAQVNQAIAQYDRASNITTLTGTEVGQALQIRKMLLAQDFSLASMESQARAAFGGKEMPEGAKARVKALHDAHAKLEVEIAKEAESAVVVEADKAIKDIKKQVKAAKGKGEPPEPQIVLDKMASGKRTDLTEAARDIARWYIMQGVTDRETIYDRVHGELSRIFPAMTRLETINALAGYGQYKELSKDALKVQLRDLIGQSQQISKIKDMLAGKAPLKSGREQRTPTDEERRLLQIVNEMKRKGEYSVTDPARQLKSALDAIHTRLKNQIADLNEEIRTGEKISKTRTTVEYDAEAKALRAERDRLKAIEKELFGDPKMTDEARINRAVAALQRSIAEYERRITQGDYFARKATVKTPPSEQIDALKAQRESTKQQLEWLKKMAKPEMRTPAELALDRWENSVLARIADLKDRMARGDFITQPRPERVLTPRLEKLQAQKMKVEAEFQAAKRRWQWQQSSLPSKAVDLTLDTFDLVRAIWTGIDLSPILRQGIMPLLAHPVRTVTEIGKAFPTLTSEEAALRHMNRIRESPQYARYQRYRLNYTEVGGPLERMEELVISNLARYIPVLAGTQRFYTALMNGLRHSSMEIAERAFGPDGKFTKEQGETMAFYVNASTGRGNLGWLERAAVPMNRVFFSPRLLMANLQMLTGAPILRATDAKARAYIAREYARMAIGWGLIYTLGYLANGEFEWNWKSSDFGKIRFGNTRIDPLRGMAQVAVLTGRLTTGERKTARGRIVPIRGPDRPYAGLTAFQIMANFMRSKLSPMFSIGLDVIAGETMDGEPVDPLTLRTAGRLVTPMAARDVYEAIREHGVPEGAALGLLFILGFGGNTYEPRTKKRRPKSFYTVSKR